MQKFDIKRAVKHEHKLRLGLFGASGSGKTYSALAIGSGIVPAEKIIVIDTENKSAALYSDRFPGFQVLELETFEPGTFVAAIRACEDAGAELIVIDGLTPAWSGKGGALEMVDAAAKRSQSSNTFMAWRDVTPQHNQMIEAIIRSRCHIIATLRAKSEYVIEQNERGRATPRKVGLAPIQRDGLEYEFDVVGQMDDKNSLIVSKSRCAELSGAIIDKPGAALAATLKNWLSGAPPETVKSKPIATPAAPGDQVASAATTLTSHERLENAVAEESVDDLKRLVSRARAVYARATAEGASTAALLAAATAANKALSDNAAHEKIVSAMAALTVCIDTLERVDAKTETVQTDGVSEVEY